MGAHESDDQSHGGSMRERADESRAKLYVLLEADRWVVTGAVMAFVFAVLVLVGTVAPVSLPAIVADSDPVGTLFQALVTAIITGVTIVVTITQLVLSQELGPVGDQRERMEGAMAFRTDTEDLLDTPVSPLEPSRFLSGLVEEAGARAAHLRDVTAGDLDDAAQSRIDEFVDSLTDDVSNVRDRLEGSQFGTFGVLSPALDFNYSVKIYDARRIRHEHGDALSEDADQALDEVVELLGYFAPAREHVKTLYFQWELTDLSREILYATVPALVVAMIATLYLDTAGMIQGTTLGVDNYVWAVSAAATVAVGPFAHLLSYVLRIATVAKRTLAIGPFVLRDIDRSGGIEWDDLDTDRADGEEGN
mgnify:CR=1 FL=1